MDKLADLRLFSGGQRRAHVPSPTPEPSPSGVHFELALSVARPARGLKEGPFRRPREGPSAPTPTLARSRSKATNPGSCTRSAASSSAHHWASRWPFSRQFLSFLSTLSA